MCNVVISQNNNDYPDLSNNDRPYFISDNYNTITPLEKAVSETKTVKEGFWGRVTVKVIPGDKSNVRLSKRNKIEFIIQLSEPNINPFTVFELKKCEIEGGRQAIMFKKGAQGIEYEKGLVLEFKKLNEGGLYLITTSKKLSKGEYFFSMIDKDDVYAFGIDK